MTIQKEFVKVPGNNSQFMSYQTVNNEKHNIRKHGS